MWIYSGAAQRENENLRHGSQDTLGCKIQQSTPWGGGVVSFRNLETKIGGRCRTPFEQSEMIRVVISQRENV